MKVNLIIILFLLLMIPNAILSGCKDKKEQPMVDIESIDDDGSRDDKYIFREELKKEQLQKEKIIRQKKQEEMN